MLSGESWEVNKRNRKMINRKFRRSFAAVLILLLALLMSSCTTYSSFKGTFIDKAGSEKDQQTITIGVFEPQTGRNAARGLEELKGIELANSIYNNVDGYKVVLSKVDTKSSVSATMTAVQGLIEMKPVAIIGSAGEATSLAASELIEEAKIPTITASATNPLITQGNSYYFRASITESQMGQGLAEYAIKEKDSENIGIVTLKNDSSVAAMKDGFETKAKDLRGRKNRTIKYEAEIMPTEEEMEKTIKQLRSNGVNICLAPLGTENMDIFFGLIEKNRMTDIIFLGQRSWGDEAFIKLMEKHPDIKIVFPYESVLTGTSSTSDSITPEAQRFQIEYANRYGSDDVPTYYAALGYDAYLIMINAIHGSKSLKGPDLRLSLMELSELKCSTGAFSFDSSGNVVRSVTLSTLKDGKPVNEYICESEAKSKVLEDVEEQQTEEQQTEEQQSE